MAAVLLRACVGASLLAAGAEGLRGGGLDTALAQFTLLNNSTLPVNFLAVPQAAPLATCRNDLRPGGTHNFTAALVLYDFHLVINDGGNGWLNMGESSWGLAKHGLSYVISHTTGTAVGQTVGTGVTFGLGALLTGIMGPAALVPVLSGTYFATLTLSSMAVSALTSNAMDYVRANTLRAVRRMGLPAVGGDANSSAGQPLPPAERHPGPWLLFDAVVTNEPVRESFVQAFPGVNTSRLLVRPQAATAYFTAMEAELKNSMAGLMKSREYVLQGGFTKPQPLEATPWFETAFSPLTIGEVDRGYCDRALELRYRDHAGRRGEIRLESNWGSQLVASKLLRRRYDRVCRKLYFAECRQRQLRVVTQCGESPDGGPDVPEWREESNETRGLAWVFRRDISLGFGEQGLRVLPGSQRWRGVVMRHIRMSVRAAATPDNGAPAV